jgi:biotin transport system substrate-specific component
MRIKTKDMILSAMFTALMVVGAYIKIPLGVVDITFQPFFCAFAGIILGARLGALSQALYMLLGLVGLPVFSKGGGPSYIFTPSFGFLLGFIAGAYVIGKVSELLKEMNFKNALISVMSGLFTLNLIGVPYMFVILRFLKNKPDFTFMSAVSLGFTPFFVKDIILFIVVAAVACQLVPALKRAGHIS